MQIQTHTLPKSQIELTIEVEPNEYQPFLKNAAKQISQETKIAGFRPGNVPYEIIKQKFGETEIMNKALGEIITHTFIDAIHQKKLDTFGQPEINITKLAPGNNLVYKAKIMLIPEIKLADLNSLSLKKTEIKIEDKEIEQTLNNLAQSRATQTLVNEPAQDKHLVKMDYTISINNVPQEDGQQKDFAVYLGEKHMVPGFEEQILGLKAGQTKKFNIKFPGDYFQKKFAGKTCTFDVKIKEVYKLNIPKINDDFAQALGKFKNLDELKKQIKENIHLEKEAAENKKTEQAMFKKIISQSDFSELPDKMIENEIETMLHELEHDLASRGLKIETWLSNMKKSLEEFKKDLRPQAELRSQSALIIRLIAEQEKIKASQEEIDNQIKQLSEVYKNNPEILDQIKSADYRNYLANLMTSQKVIDWLKKKIVK